MVNDDDEKLAEAMIGLGKEELAKRIHNELEAGVRDALRELVHPVTGEKLITKGMSVADPPRHDEGGLSNENKIK